MNIIKLDNIEKIAQGRVSSGFSPNPVQDIRIMSKWVIELVSEVRRLNNQRLVYRARVSRLHKLISQYPESHNFPYYATEEEMVEYHAKSELAAQIRKIFESEDK